MHEAPNSEDLHRPPPEAGLAATLRTVLGLFDRRTRRRLWRFALAYVALAILDFLALALIATALGSGKLDQPATARVELPQPLRWLVQELHGAATVPLVTVVAIALGVFAIRSLLSALVTRRSLRFLGRLDGELGTEAIARELRLPWIDRIRRARSDVIRDITDGPNIIVQDFLGSLLLAWGEVLTLLAVIVVLAAADPAATAVTVLYFGAILWVLTSRVRSRAGAEGKRAFQARGKSIATLNQALDAYKELLVRQRTGAFAERAGAWYRTFADSRAEAEWLFSFTRFYLEAALMLGLAIVTAVAAALRGTEGAVGVLVLFAAGGFRALPALHRFQVLAARLRVRMPYVGAIVAILDVAGDDEPVADAPGAAPEGPRAALDRRLEIRDLSITYPGAKATALRHVDLDVAAGTRLAVVGPSGAGKTTLADALLGLLPVPDGCVFADGVDVGRDLEAWRRAVGYVPQQVTLVDDTIGANVALGWFGTDIDEDAAWSALERAHAATFVRSLPDQLATTVGEQGVRLSGGERQRIGIARALFHNPTFLVLDEATSALDVSTEAAITETLAGLHGSVTILVIAHRLATVRDADVVVYLEDGEVRAIGSFADVTSAEPRFAEQARLAGLTPRAPSGEPEPT